MPLLHLESLPARTTKGEILHLLCGAGGIDREQVGLIELRGTVATVEVPVGWERRLAKTLDGAELKGRRLRVRAGGVLKSAGPDDHFANLARLIQLESEEEARQALDHSSRRSAAEAEAKGECLAKLVVVEESFGLGGRCILTLAKRDRTRPLPFNRLEPGAPVLLALEGNTTGAGWRGVVCERNRNALSVAFPEPPDTDEHATTFRLDLSTDEISRQRQLAALDQAGAARGDRLAQLRDVLLGDRPPELAAPVDLVPLDTALDASQRDAVAFALSARDVAVVHGPPGTGKTTAVVELIRQAIRRGERVLACAPSNLAVDNLLERLLQGGEKAVRLGHPARVTPALREHTLDLLAQDHNDTRLARKLVREAFALFRQADKRTRAKPEPGARRDLRQEARGMLGDARRLEALAVDHVLDTATVLCATLTGLNGDVLGRRSFDLGVIDEAAQATEPACWPALLRCARVVLAGDHRQLPPTILSREADAQGLGVSLMERVVGLYGVEATRRLDVQYRMHAAIMAYPSEALYDGTLQAHPSVAGHTLGDLAGVEALPLTAAPVEFIDTAGADYDEEVEPDGESRFNPGEANLVVHKVNALLAAGVAAEGIAVIAPYAAQVRLLRDRLATTNVEIDSVDGFQGREKEAVILSLVRSNPEGEIGFLADVRRMNVAMTRARRKLIVVGNSATLSNHPFYRDLLGHCETTGAYRSVWEEDV
jgi:ATP-dependent RNA/DNA helicase IGHMBP2